MANWTTPRDWSAGETLTAAYMNEQLRDNFKAAFPVGKWDYFGQAATTGETLINGAWLECNGVSVLRATYPELNTYLSALGYPYGTADGTHMTLPDGQARALYGMASGGHADVNAIGDSDGLAKASRTPKETVSISGTSGAGGTGATGASGGHTHTVTTTDNFIEGGTQVLTSLAAVGDHTHTGPSHTHTFSDSDVLSGAFVVGGVWAIKAKS